SEFPHVVEYGNQLATRVVVTEGQGFAEVVEGEVFSDYGYVDWIIQKNDDTAEEISDEPPTQAERDAWRSQGTAEVHQRFPPPLAIVLPANTTLLPGSPWRIEDLIPGAWFRVNLTRMCRTVTEDHKLQHVVVTEDPSQGEQIQITSVAAPRGRINP
ncbi:MAG TPA: hypothetical protein VIX41_11020, partial [Acidimicrobiales bacterium]